jgi:prepilin-type N-terminal cleavage/methylation domain-containing protein
VNSNKHAGETPALPGSARIGKFHALGLILPGNSAKMSVALPMLAMETEMKLQPTTHGSRALTLTELLVVIFILAVAAALFLPALAAAKRKSSHINCVSCLKQNVLAFKVWEGDNGDKNPMQVSVTNGGAMELAVAGNVSAIFGVMSNELSTPKVLFCPEDTGRHYATNFTTDLNHQTISYFVGLDAEDKYPQMIISGDDNLEVNGVRVRPGILNLSTNAPVEWTENERHGLSQKWSFRNQHLRIGNIGLADGSVQTTTTSALQSAFVNTGSATNRLVIP